MADDDDYYNYCYEYDNDALWLASYDSYACSFYDCSYA
jgi:hypothetical protein